MAPSSLNESEFNHIVDETIIAIEDALDELDVDIDYETGGGILTISLDNLTKVIINRQTPLKQLWVAAKSGGYHLDWHTDIWQTDREQEELSALLNRVFNEQAEQKFEFTLDY